MGETNERPLHRSGSALSNLEMLVQEVTDQL